MKVLKFSMYLVVAVVLVCFVGCGNDGKAVAEKSLDVITFGDAASESAHSFATPEEVAGQKESVISIEGLGDSCRHVVSGGQMSFKMKCEPNEVTFLTVKVWGDDYLGKEFTTIDGEQKKIEAPQFDIFIDGEFVYLKRGGQKEKRYPMLATADLDGRFYYETFMVDESLTKGRSEITISIRTTAAVGGKYAKVGGPKPTVIGEGKYTRGIYAAYTHIDNFTIPSNENLGRGKSCQFKPSITKDEVKQYLTTQLDVACAEIMSRQLYGPEWETKADEIGIPKYLTGLFDWEGLDVYFETGKGKKGDDEYWRERVSGSASGRSHALAGALFIKTYNNPLSKFHKDPELLKRAMAALDGYCVYQGAEGTLEIGGGSWGWIGGPKRSKAGGGLPGFFAKGLAASFSEIWGEIKDSPELVDEMIDNNGDGEKSVTRKQAYTELFTNYVKYRQKQRGGVSNQDMANFLGLYRCNEILRILNPKEMVANDYLETFMYQSMGIEPGFSGKNPRARYWISPKGTSVEGGFTPHYSQMQSFLSEAVDISNDEKLIAQLNSFCGSFQNYVYPLCSGDKFLLNVEGPVGSRHRNFHYNDNGVSWLGFIVPAIKLKNPAAIRIMQLHVYSADAIHAVKLDKSLRMHLNVRAIYVAELLENFDAIYALPMTDYHLPAERAGDYFWADEMAKNVLIKDRHGLLHLSFDQWYRDVSRYHSITKKAQAFGDLEYENRDNLYITRYGDYLVVMNSTHQIYADTPGEARTFKDERYQSNMLNLIDGKKYNLSQGVTIEPDSTLIFRVK